MRLHPLLTLLLIVFSLGALPATAVERVRVGAYHFPPYMIKPESPEASGLLPELLTLLNHSQSDYQFELVPTAVTRRYRDFEQGRFDLILFESPSWGWQGTPLSSVDLLIEDAEVYVARAEPGRDQGYFANLQGKRLALYNGYHYGFAGFNADQDFLTQQYNAVLTYSHDSNLLMLLKGRADVAVITRSYLQLYQDRNPEQGAAFLVSQRVDQVYHHHALLRPQAPIDAEAFARLMQQVRGEGRLRPLLERYHLSLLEP
ncbi:MAG: ABC transporter substrate-binding protein [Pseudomonas sp.]|uniref:substrate-binding periplasmic protein n=1 Tax=Pseudomonas sp. TaxID=306 RepID=UPI0033960307